MKRIDYLEIYVSNLPAAVRFYKNTFQFHPIAYSEQNDHSSVLIHHGSIRFVLTASKTSSSDVAHFILLHGEGVKDIAFITENVESQFELAIQKGHQAILAPTTYIINDELIQKATVSAFGEITHTFIQRQNENQYSLPFFSYNQPIAITKEAIFSIDHLAVCVHQGDLSYIINDYLETYGFIQSHEESIITTNSGMNSKVVQSRSGQIKIVFLEPLQGLKQSQIEEFLISFGGPGVQHIAFATNNIISAVKTIRDSGLEMLSIPDQYYEIQKK